MEELQQLVRFIERKGRLSGSQLLNFADEESLETKLYFYLKENNNCEESTVIEYLYSSAGKKDAFKMLKSRFRKKLFNQLNFLNFSFPGKEPSLIDIELNCGKLLLETKVLIKQSNESLAEKQLIKALKMAQEANLTKLIVEALEQYVEILAYQGVRNKVYNLKAELEEQYKILDLEREANLLFRLCISEYKSGVTSREKYLTQLEENVSLLKNSWEKTNNAYVYTRYYHLKMIHLELTGNYSLQLDFLLEVRQAFEKGFIHPLYFNKKLNMYVYTYACLKSGRLEEGLQEAPRLNQILMPGIHNWFVHNENFFILAMHSRKYDKAGEILSSVLSLASFNDQKPLEKSKWALHTSFFQLLINKNVTFNISENLKDLVPDKKGYNIWIIILDFLTLLKDGKFELLNREAERIRKYISKHLDAKSDPRNKYFLRLLLLVVKEEFDPVLCKMKGKYLYNKLTKTPPSGDAYAEIEIVPLEHLWEMILDFLGRRN